jgi:hypothetical protein
VRLRVDMYIRKRKAVYMRQTISQIPKLHFHYPYWSAFVDKTKSSAAFARVTFPSASAALLCK